MLPLPPPPLSSQVLQYDGTSGRYLFATTQSDFWMTLFLTELRTTHEHYFGSWQASKCLKMRFMLGVLLKEFVIYLFLNFICLALF